MSKQRFSCGGLGRVLALSVAVLFATNYLCAGDQAVPEESSYRIFPLKHISAEQGRQYLAELAIGTVSKFPGSPALLVTARSSEITKAQAVLGLVDANEPFVVKALFPASESAKMPTSAQIAERVKDISIGTFTNPPAASLTGRTIIDVQKDSVVIVAPSGLAEKVVSAIAAFRQAAETAKVPEVEPQRQAVEPNKAEVGPTKLTEPVRADKIEIIVMDEANEPNDAGALAKANGASQKTGAAEAPAQNGPTAQKPGVQEAGGFGAYNGYKPEPIGNGNDVLRVELPEKLDIVNLFGLVGEYYNLVFMYDPVKVKGDVTLKVHGQLKGPLKVKDLYPLLEKVLKFKQFVMTRGEGNIIMIVPAAEAQDVDPILLEPGKGAIQHGDVVVTRPFRLEYVDTTSAQNLLTSMKLGQSISPIPATGTLIVTEYAYRMPRVESLLEMIDQPGKPKEFRFRQLKYTMAQTLASKVKNLAEQLGTISVTVSAPTPTAPTMRTIPGRPPPPARPTIIRPTTPTTAPTEESVYLDADERTNRILMIGLDEQLETVEELIDALDVEQQDLRTLKLYEVKNVDALEAVKKLQELGIIRTSAATSTRSTRISTSAAATRAGQPGTRTLPEATTTTAAGSETEPLAEEAQVIVIETTNSLLANATPEQHAQIRMILSYVDSEILGEIMPYKIYKLESQKPADVAAVLDKLIAETIQDKEGKIERVVKKTEEEIVIVPDDNTFSIIVYASKKNQDWIETLIKTLDRRRPQVLIDVTLVEVTRTDLFDMDLQLATKSDKLAPGGSMDVVGAITEPFLSRRAAEAFSAPFLGTAQGFYSDRHIQALLTALQTKSYGRVLAKPKILVNDGQPGTISTQDRTNIKLQDVLVPQEGNSQVTTKFQEFAAGIELTITPNISEGELLLLEVQLTRSDFGDPPESGSPPDTTESKINTTVTVPNDRTIILGGMLKLNQSRGGTKVPLLGDIPVIGGLFRSVSNTARDSKLYVFVKANILRPAEGVQGLPELERISDQSVEAFGRHELEFQRYEDWPGIKPRPMEPVKVLEAQ
jgi:general secretion pathway protein D